MFLLCKHVRLTCVFNKLMMMMMMKASIVRESLIVRGNLFQTAGTTLLKMFFYEIQGELWNVDVKLFSGT